MKILTKIFFTILVGQEKGIFKEMFQAETPVPPKKYLSSGLEGWRTTDEVLVRHTSTDIAIGHLIMSDFKIYEVYNIHKGNKLRSMYCITINTNYDVKRLHSVR